MADDTSTTEATPASGEAEQQPPKVDVPPEVKRALREANKEAETLRLRLKEFEDRDKTETQRLLEERDALRAERDSVRAEAMRARVALAKGLPSDLADRLRGSSEEELAEDADRLLDLLKPPAPARFGDVGQGVRTPPPDTNLDERQAARALFGGST